MNDPMKDAWNDVAEGFGSLGRLMKERFEVEADEAGQPPSADDTAGGEALREAFERFVAAGRDVGQRAVEVLRDDDVKVQAKQAATALNDALSATVDLIGREVGGFFGRGDEPAEQKPTDVVTGPVEAEPDVARGDVGPSRADET